MNKFKVARVGRERLLCRGDLAGVDDDEELHKVVIDLATATLDHKHILVPHILLDFNLGLTVGKETKLNLQSER